MNFFSHIREKLLAESRIPARFPSGKRSVDRESRGVSMRSDLATAKRNRPSFEANMETLKNPNLYKDVPASKLEGASADDTAELFINHFKDNLLHIHDNMTPEARQAARGWYDTANKMVTQRYDHYKRMSNNLTPAGVAGVYAALSPGNEWNNNIALGDRVMHIYHEKKHEPWSPEMDQTAQRIWGEKHAPVLNQIRGKTLGELDDPAHKAMWIRTYDEAHHARDHAVWGPDGKPTGARSRSTRWQSVANIAKAVRSIESAGDMNEISRLMGKSHKVRNFYNNIIEPNSPVGDVTIDTHAVAAAHYKPFGQSAVPVIHAFGNNPGVGKKPAAWQSMKSGGANTGIKGTDYMYQEAYRRAAAERGLKPRELQSIAWEGIRAKFPDKKTKVAKQALSVWAEHHAGKIDANEARRQIDALPTAKPGKIPTPIQGP